MAADSSMGTEDALELWRGASKQIERIQNRADLEFRSAYEAASARALAALQQFESVAALVSAYDSEHLEKLLALIMRECERQYGVILNYGLVEDTAYWRRYTQLFALHVQP